LAPELSASADMADRVQQPKRRGKGTSFRTLPFKARLAAVFLPFVVLFVLLSNADVPFRALGIGRAPQGSAGAKSEASSPAPSAGSSENVSAPRMPQGSASSRSRSSESDVSRQPAAAVSGSEQSHAIELLIGGNYAAALRAYEALARAHPASGSYREAARILRQRVGATRGN